MSWKAYRDVEVRLPSSLMVVGFGPFPPMIVTTVVPPLLFVVVTTVVTIGGVLVTV